MIYDIILIISLLSFVILILVREEFKLRTKIKEADTRDKQRLDYFIELIAEERLP